MRKYKYLIATVILIIVLGITFFTISGAFSNLISQYGQPDYEDAGRILSSFERLRSVVKLSHRLAVFEIFIFILYLVWMFISMGKDHFEQENQLGRVRYMFEVEKTLFDAHLHPDHMEDALKKIAITLTAETGFLLIFDGKKVTERHVWNDGVKGTGQPVIIGCYESLYGLGDMNHSVICYNARMPASLEKEGIHNFMTAPVIGIDGRLAGILGVYNMKHRWKDATALECVSLSFAMAINNIQVYQSIRSMGALDSLTGLLNRNSYHLAVAELDKDTFHSLACVYMDANGLHEMNNHLGHREGDRMLCTIAQLLNMEFGPEHTYRIGGDEFVAFCKNLEQEEVVRRVCCIKELAGRQSYEISTGIEWRDSDFDIDSIVKAAEHKMRQDKQRYYEMDGAQRRNREFNYKLEKMIMEKQDADTFLSVIAPDFKGVYFVNLDTDAVRDLFIPEYFDEMLKRSGGRFSKAMELYAREKVTPEYSCLFRQLFDYDVLENLFRENKIPDFIYQKTDGSWMRVKVLKFNTYPNGDKDTLWIFNPEDVRDETVPPLHQESEAASHIQGIGQ